MKKHTEPLRSGCFYHIYNRGVNGEDLFKEEKNYQYFLSQYAKYVYPIAETYAYCLLKNHFHFLIRTRSAQAIIQNVYRRKKLNVSDENVSEVPNLADVEKMASNLISRQFGILFNSYAQAINKMYKRHGGLFEDSFRRVGIKNEAHCCWVLSYINTNAQHHRFVKDFRDYPHSSYHAFLSKSPTRLMREEVLKWFGGVKEFVQYHLDKKRRLDFSEYQIEFE